MRCLLCLVLLVACGGGDTESDAPEPFQEPALSVGGVHACAVDGFGVMTCWGANHRGQAEQSGTDGWATLDAGHSHTCGLTLDGALSCFGRGGASEPGPFDAVSAGNAVTCALAGEAATCWGMAAPAGRLLAISAGDNHACGLTVDDAVVCSGDDAFGQATPPAGRFIAVGSGSAHSCALATDGTPTCWGNNDADQLNNVPSVALATLTVGGTHACGLDAGGAAICWGQDSRGMATPPADATFVGLSAGHSNTCGLQADGQVTCWGANGDGQSDAPGI